MKESASNPGTTGVHESNIISPDHGQQNLGKKRMCIFFIACPL
jgi:hypothetical protein